MLLRSELEHWRSENSTCTGGRVVFVGNPNSGKTTLFNRLTGLRAKTGNFPGTTIELRRARCPLGERKLEYVDLPGLYGLLGNTPEERVASEYLEELSRDGDCPTLVVLVVDATRLERNLYLVSQVRERVPHVLVALNMADLVAKSGLILDTEALAVELGAGVIELSARTGHGLPQLRGEIHRWAREGGFPLFTDHSPPCVRFCAGCEGCPHRARFLWAEEITRRVAHTDGRRQSRNSWEALDRLLTHPVGGLLVFVVVMVVLFQALFWLAEYPMEWFDTGFVELGGLLSGWLPEGYWSGFILDGVLTGVAGAVVFLPQICMLFFLLTLLEDTGYLARAVFVADRWMARVGLPGRAFLPILSAHACAIPAIMSTRSIESGRDRLITMLVLPLFTCSARIPVYVMVTAMLFPNAPWKAGLVFTGAYFLGIVAAFGTAFLLRGFVLKGEPIPLLIELPSYKPPSLRTALLTTLDRGWIFLRKAGTVIVLIISVLWVLTQFPMLPDGVGDVEDSAAVAMVDSVSGSDALGAQRQLEYSVIGRLGKWVQPVFAPLGFDWQITVGLLTSFAAREVVVSTLSVLYGLGEEGAGDTGGIAERLRVNLSPATGLCLLVFFVLAMQCLPTQVVTRRETGTWKWPLLQLGYMSTLAYASAFLVFQLASIIWP